MTVALTDTRQEVGPKEPVTYAFVMGVAVIAAGGAEPSQCVTSE